MPADLCAIHPPRHARPRVPCSLWLEPQAADLLAELAARTGRSRRAVVEAAIYAAARAEGILE